jgi:hypothetical protein
MKVSRQCRLVLLAKVGCKESKGLGTQERSVTPSGLLDVTAFGVMFWRTAL